MENAYETVRSTHYQACDIGRFLEELHWHEWVLSKSLLAKDKYQRHEAADDDENNDFWRAPGKYCAPKVQAQQQHERQTKDGQATEPINGLDTFDCVCPWIVNIHEECKHDKSDSTYREVDVEIPPPRHKLGKSTPKNRSNTTSKRPHALEQAHVETPFAHGEEI